MQTKQTPPLLNPTARHTVLPPGKMTHTEEICLSVGLTVRAREQETKHKALFYTELMLWVEVSHCVGVWVMADSFLIYIQTQRDT